MLVNAGRFLLTDATLDRDKDIILPEGGDIKHFLKNPILLYNHGSSGIGRVENIALENNAWYGDLMVDPDAHDYNEKNLIERIILETLSMVSIRFAHTESERNEFGGRTFKKWELIEVSLVDIPANPNAQKVKYFVTHNNKKMKFSDLLNKFFGIKEDTTPEEAEKLIQKSLETEKVKETLKSYDASIKDHIEKALGGLQSKIGEIEKSCQDLQDENKSLKGQLAEVLGKSATPNGESFEGKDGDDDDDEEGVFDLVKFHEKNFK